MRREEACAIARWMADLNLPEGAVCLNVGSSTGDFRNNVQPHIQQELFGPLAAAGIKVIHCDMKDADGVDEVGDLLDPAFRERLKTYDAQAMICSNLLEHLTDPHTFASACGELVVPGGYGFITVPYSYPYHPDPIDTSLRPSPDELARMLPGWEVIKRDVVAGGNHWQDLKKSGEPWKRLSRQVLRTLMPFYRPSHWPHIAHRLLWLKRPFTSSAVLLRKPA